MVDILAFIIATFRRCGQLLFNANFVYSNSRVSLGSVLLAFTLIVIVMSVFWKGGHK